MVTESKMVVIVPESHFGHSYLGASLWVLGNSELAPTYRPDCGHAACGAIDSNLPAREWRPELCSMTDPGRQAVENLPRGSNESAIVELGPKNHTIYGFRSPISIMALQLDPLGYAHSHPQAKLERLDLPHSEFSLVAARKKPHDTSLAAQLPI